MPSRPTPLADIGLTIFLIAVCGLVLWETRRIPPGVFEPLGSAPVPQATATILILLCIVVLVQALLILRRRGTARPEATSAADPSDTPERPAAVAVTGVLTVLYVLALSMRLTSYAVTTAIFLFAAISFLARFRLRALPIAAVIAVAMGYGCQCVFTRIFVVDLPTY